MQDETPLILENADVVAPPLRSSEVYVPNVREVVLAKDAQTSHVVCMDQTAGVDIECICVSGVQLIERCSLTHILICVELESKVANDRRLVILELNLLQNLARMVRSETSNVCVVFPRKIHRCYENEGMQASENAEFPILIVGI